MSARGSFADRRRTRAGRTLLSSDRWPLVAVVSLYTGMVMVSVLAGAEGYWLGFANGAGLLVLLSMTASCSACRPARYFRSPLPSTAAVWVPEQRTEVQQGRPHGVVRDSGSSDGSLSRSP